MSLVTTVKFVIFSKRKYRPEVKLKLDGIELDYTDAYLYLGVLFHYTNLPYLTMIHQQFPSTILNHLEN
jgi:hypothetical protein